MTGHEAGPESREALREDLYRRFSEGGLRRSRRARALRGMLWFMAIRVAPGLKRALDFVVALVLLAALSPLMVLVAGWLLASKGKALERTPVMGRWCVVFDRLRFAAPDKGWLARTGLRGTPVLLNILRGEMSGVGPRGLAPGEMSPRDREARKRYNVRPGVVSLWWLRQRANIAYEREASLDAEYVESQSLKGDLGIALRAVPAMLVGHGVATAPDEVEALGVRMHNVTMAEAVEQICGWAGADQPRQVCFVNADCLNISRRDEDYKAVLNRADMTLADGIGVRLAGKILGWDIRQNVNGTDLFPRLCDALAAAGRSVFLLGARPGVAERVAAWMARREPAARVAGTRHGYFSEDEEAAVAEEIARSNADVLLVALGAPRQDKWIARRLKDTGVKVAMGVGGLFDFYSGRVARAPVWMRELGLEWFFRFLQEPGRMWKRYFVGNVVFLWRVGWERLRRRPAG